MTTRLSVNVNKVALLRNQRDLDMPSVARFSRLALEAGAHGITIHPRPDERHVRAHDVDDLAALLAEPAWSDREFNIEGNPLEGRYIEHCLRVKPTQCTLVPDDPRQATSDHGWDLSAASGNVQRLTPIVAQLKDAGCRVSLFMDADPAVIARAPATGADRIELYTEPYAKAFDEGGEVLDRALARFTESAEAARAQGLGVNAGHDLNLDNLPAFAEVPGIEEVSIGHALTAEALEFGWAETVRRYLKILER